MKNLIFLVVLSIFFFPNKSFSGENDTITSSKTLLYEKVYLHIDRELYAPGDDIWFKSYLVSGINNRLIPGYKNIYIQLISEKGEVVENRLLLSHDGTAKGDIQLANDLPDGEYTIRAKTKYLENFGEESYFHKKIVVAASKNSFELAEQATPEKPVKIDVAFLPESGNLVMNAINQIAFKAIDEHGKGISVKGKIVDEEGNEVVTFRTRYKGMGKFMMMPQEGKSYFAKIDEYPDFNFAFEPAKINSVALSYKPEGNYLQFTLSRNLKINLPQNYTLKATHKGIELFSSQVVMTEFQHAQRLFKGLFPLGMSKISVLDEHGNKVAERMVFVQNENDVTLELELNKEDFKTRDKVEIDVTALLPETDTILSTLSVSVVHEDYFSATGNNQTIESYLLLDSELRGSIESPASCFINEQQISSDEKLDLIMMVNGWRSYYWDDLEPFRGRELPGWDDYGLSIKGSVIKQWGGKPVENGKVVMGPFSSSFLFEETRTDSYGNFSFDRLYLKDQAKIMINAETEKGSKRTDLTLEPQMKFDLMVPVGPLKNSSPGIDIPLKFYRENYFRLLRDKEFKLASGILLDEVTLVEKRIFGDGHFRLYSEPDLSFEITEDDQQYFSVLDYLEMKSIPGVIISGEEIRIRNGSRNPLLLVDGLDTEWIDIINIPISDIDKIEILKTGFASATFGSRGGDGVISILTKMGKGEWEANWTRIIHGRITPNVDGYQLPREFYSPKYSAENINDQRPDFRPTLLWDPEVKITNGEAKIGLYTADNLARYHVVVEGVSKMGKICYATSLLTVSVPRK